MATTDTAMVLDTVMATMADMVTILARGLLRPSLRLPLPLLPRLMLSPAMVTTVMATTATVTVWATVTATTVPTMARGLLMLSPAMATTVTAMVLDTVMATMADMVTILARGLLRPSLRLPLPLLPRLMLSPAM